MLVSDIHISQDNVATYLKFGEIFIAIFRVSVPAKKVRKSVNIWQRQGQNSARVVFLTHVVVMCSFKSHDKFTE